MLKGLLIKYIQSFYVLTVSKSHNDYYVNFGIILAYIWTKSHIPIHDNLFYFDHVYLAFHVCSAKFCCLFLPLFYPIFLYFFLLYVLNTNNFTTSFKILFAMSVNIHVVFCFVCFVFVI